MTIRPFADFLTDLNSGASHAELGEKLNELICSVRDYGKVGTLTYTIRVAPAGRAEGMVQISDDIRTKLPTGARPESMWFVTPDGNVTRDSPNQPRLPLREVGGGRSSVNDTQEVAGND